MKSELSKYSCVAVSACLLGQNCKYNGENNYSAKLEKMLCGKKIIAVCPEVMGGLRTPRKPCEIKNGKVQTADGQDVTAHFKRGAELALNVVQQNGAQAVVLQSRSPSCGAKQIYDGTFSKKLIQGKGVFAKLLSDNGIEIIDIEAIAE